MWSGTRYDCRTMGRSVTVWMCSTWQNKGILQCCLTDRLGRHGTLIDYSTIPHVADPKDLCLWIDCEPLFVFDTSVLLESSRRYPEVTIFYIRTYLVGWVSELCRAQFSQTRFLENQRFWTPECEISNDRIRLTSCPSVQQGRCKVQHRHTEVDLSTVEKLVAVIVCDWWSRSSRSLHTQLILVG